MSESFGWTEEPDVTRGESDSDILCHFCGSATICQWCRQGMEQ